MGPFHLLFYYSLAHSHWCSLFSACMVIKYLLSYCIEKRREGKTCQQSLFTYISSSSSSSFPINELNGCCCENSGSFLFFFYVLHRQRKRLIYTTHWLNSHANLNLNPSVLCTKFRFLLDSARTKSKWSTNWIHDQLKPGGGGSTTLSSTRVSIVSSFGAFEFGWFAIKFAWDTAFVGISATSALACSILWNGQNLNQHPIKLW